MAKSKRPKNKRSKVQLITNEPRYVLVGSYLTKRGNLELAMARTAEELDLINTKHRKNQYKLNPACNKVERIIIHQNLK